MIPIPALIALGQLVPALLRWVGSDKAADVADQAVGVAKQITGAADADAAVAALQANPEQLVQYQRAMNEVVMAQLDADIRALEAVNATMRVEASSGDAYVRRARPTFMYVMALTWACQTVGMIAAVLRDPALAAELLRAQSELTTLWGIALAVVGVAVKARSDDKARALGYDAPSVVESVTNLIKRGEK